MPENNQHIDELNKKAWELRYTDLGESRKNSEQALNLAEKSNYTLGANYAKLNLAVNHFLKSENKEALELLTEVQKFFSNQEKEKGLPVALTFIGNIYESFGNYESGLDFCQKALRLTREQNYKEGEGDALSVIGLIYSRLADYDNALQAYQESLKIREELDDKAAVASSLNRIARIFALKKEYHRALEYYEESLIVRHQAKQFSALPWTYLGMASTYEEMGELENAQEYYQKNLGEGTGDIDKRCRLQCTLGLGRVLFRMGDMEEAHIRLTNSLKQAEELDAKPLQYETHSALANYYESIGDYEKSLNHYKKYHDLREEVYNAEAQNRLKNQQIAFAVEKSEKEKEIYQLRNVELKAAYDEIQLKNIAITDSINYASRIQSALLPQQKTLQKALPQHFILFLPRDIVSGDFYWASEMDNKVILAAADCTGHGVPGAFMSMLGITFLDEIVNKRNVISANEILNDLREEVIKALKQTGKEEEQKDGMDIALCVYDRDTAQLEFSGAYNSLYLIRNNELEEYKADRMPISYYGDIYQSFNNQLIQIKPGDTIYIFSDGYADQFGGPKGKKFKYRALQELLLSIHTESMEQQKQILEQQFMDWKGEIEQIDDVIVIGLKL